MTPAEARVGARVTWADNPEQPVRNGSVVAVFGGLVAVEWDGHLEHPLADLRLLPDEAP